MKKLLALALALCLSLTVPAFAAEAPHDVNIIGIPATWENYGDRLPDDSKLTINGVIGQEPFEDTILFDVTADGGFTLDMNFPAGRTRYYGAYASMVLLNREYAEEPDPYFPEESGGWFFSDDPQDQYVFICTENMISKPGAELLYEFWLDWDEGSPDSDYSTYSGNVNFWLRVNPTPVNQAYASTQKVDVDGKAVEFQMYALKDENGNDTNYIKLRDLAQILNGTQAQFEVGWDGAVNIVDGAAYTANGSEMVTPFSGDRAYEVVTTPTNVNGKPVSLNAFILKDDNGGAYTYYQLRDLGQALGFNVGWSSKKGVCIETDRPYGSGN